MQVSEILDLLKTIFSGLVVVGLLIGFFQVRAALRVSRANVLLRLIQEYGSPETYAAMRYVHGLRQEWKHQEPDYRKWRGLAESWVNRRVEADSESSDSDEQRRADEWWKRRTASQFVSKMGYLMMQGYISRDDLFAVVPEVPRLLMVLNPIEQSVCKYFGQKETPVEEWDVPFDKLLFDALLKEHKKWFKKTGQKHVSRMGRV